ncbi:MAG: hypothetical protein U5L45_00235 [Saprospiraceae bacterium]|nr:hypothetical protein [Saprospiraceae bacterium]
MKKTITSGRFFENELGRINQSVKDVQLSPEIEAILLGQKDNEPFNPNIHPNIVKILYNIFKKKHNLNDEIIASAYGYSDANSFRNSERYLNIIAGAVFCFSRS